jgi:mannitol-1-phosphate/altronate dehydrogenase
MSEENNMKIPEYEVGLIARFGMPAVRDLIERAQKTRVYKWSRQELLEIIDTYTLKAKQMKASKLKTA